MKTLFYKLIYNKQINKLLRFILQPINRLLKNKIHFPLNGVIPFFIDKDTSFKLEMNESSPMCTVYWNGAANFEFTTIFKEIIKNCDVFLDIGSNLGFYSFLAEKSNPNVTIHAFEPSNGAFHFLSSNLKHNKSKNVFVHKVALSDQKGNITFHEEINPKYPYLKHFLSGMSNTLNVKGMRKSSTYNVETTTLEDFVKNQQLTKIDLIKIDTEGSEYSILNKSISIIKQFQPIIICEVISENAATKIGNFTNECNYLSYVFSNNKLIRTSKIQSSEKEDERNIFLIPESKVLLLTQFINKNS